MALGDSSNSTKPYFRPEIVRQVENDTGVLCGVLGITLNALMLLVLYRKKQILGDTSRRIVVNQSIIDIVVSVFLIWSQYHSLMFGPYMPEDIGNPWLYCNLIWSTYFLWGAITASSWNLQVLTIERYMSVCHPFKHRNYCTRLIITITLVLVWVAAFTWQIFVIIFIQYDEASDLCLLIPNPPEAFMAYLVGFQIHAYFIPMFHMSYCYGRMIVVLKRRVTSSDQQDSSKSKQTRSFTVTCLLISVAYAVCFTLNSLYITLASILSVVPFDATSAVYKTSVIMTFFNSFVNPIIYFSRIQAFRRELGVIFTCGKSMESVDDGSRRAQEQQQQQSSTATGVPHSGAQSTATTRG